jgi:hypothetical protein
MGKLSIGPAGEKLSSKRPSEMIEPKTIYVDRIVEVEVEKIVEKIIEIEKRVEVPVHIEKIISVPSEPKIVYVDKIVEVEKLVQVPAEIIEKIVEVEKIVTVKEQDTALLKEISALKLKLNLAIGAGIILSVIAYILG